MRTKIIVSHRDGVCEIEQNEWMMRYGERERVRFADDGQGLFLYRPYGFRPTRFFLKATGAPGIYTTEGRELPWKKIKPEKPIEGCALPEEKIGTTIVSNFFVNVHETVWPTPEKENPLNLPDKISKLIAYANTLGFDAIITGTSSEDMTIIFR